MVMRTVGFGGDDSNTQLAIDGGAHGRDGNYANQLTPKSGIDNGALLNGHGAPGLAVGVNGSHAFYIDASHAVFPLDLSGFQASANHGPIQVGGGDGPVTQAFADVHLDTQGSHWVLTDGVDTIVLTGATAVNIEGQTYRLVDHFGSGQGGYQSVQAGVDGAGTGDIVLIAGGDYTEQVVVDGHTNLTVQALDGDDVNIVAPADVVQHGTSTSGRALNSVVTVTDSTNVQLVDIGVDGAGHGDTIDGPSANYLGVVYRNASGGLTDVDITGVRDPALSGAQHGVGLQVDNDSGALAFFMHGGSITDFQKNGTVFNHADLDVSGVTVTGAGATTLNAQNGIQVLNSTGSIHDNVVTAIGYAGTGGDPSTDPYSGGILIGGGNSDLTVHDNTVVGANNESAAAKIVGIWQYTGVNDGGGIYDNDVSFCDTGVGVYGDIGSSGFDVHGNSVTDVDPTDYYVVLNPQYAGVDFEPTSSLTTAFDVSGSQADDYLAGAAGGDILHGLSGDDGLYGGDGSDTLYGGTGADTMAGGDGDDTYYVDNSGDVVTEAVGEGTDTAFASVSYTLAAGSEVEFLTGNAGATGLALTGNEFSQTITGLTGNDTLDGAGGVDTMVGGDGDDTYYADNTGDVVTENSGEGTDLVYASADYTLSANVENLTLLDAADDIQTFDDMAVGEITDGENGWTVLAGGRDQGVVDLGGGNHAFQMSSDPSVADFAGPYSPELSVAAGESSSGAGATSQLIEYDFQAVSTAAGDLSRLEIDFGKSDGTDRNNFLVIENTDDGIRIAVADPDLAGDFGDAGTFPDDWRELASGIDNSVAHHLEMRLTYVDGPDNDIIQVYLDGNLIGSTTTFENYHDSLGGTHDDNAADNTTDRVFFRPSANGAPQDGAGGANQGFLIDNLHSTTYNDLDGTGNDDDNVITGNSGDNALSGMGGADTIYGGVGEDTVSGGAGEDIAYGGNNNDTMGGGGDNDTLNGDDGGDILDGGAGDDTLNGGAGSDTAGYLSATSAVKVNLAIAGVQDTLGGGMDTLTGIENVIGSNFDDRSLKGNANANVLSGMGGKDTLFGQDGDDSLFGGAAKDKFSGGNGEDSLIGGAGSDKMSGGADADTFYFADGFGNDTIKDFNVAEDSLVFDPDISGTIHVAVVGSSGTLVSTDAGDSVFLKGVLVDVSGNILVAETPEETQFYTI